MQRRRCKAVLRKPTANRAQERPVMKIQMRSVGEKLDSDVSRFPYRFQEINGHRPASMDLRRDSELHEGIVQEHCAFSGFAQRNGDWYTKGTEKRLSGFVCAFL